MSKADVVGLWFNRNEDRIIERYCPAAACVQLEALNAAIRDEPWSAQLEGKRVLVVHPFAKTIASQYRLNRKRLFENPKVLPDFELMTLAAVQSSAGGECGFSSWFEGLDHMNARMRETEFDIAIIGAGAYGLPLAAAVKDSGRQAVHMGGATQLLFGVIGRRWEMESAEDVARIVNEHWVRPSQEETPEGAGLVEGACYW